MAKKPIELSHRMIPGREHFKLETRTFDVTELLPEVKHRPEIWYVLTDITMSSHMGTHVEFPYHHWRQGASGADFPLANLMGPGAVVDLSRKKHQEAITLAELKGKCGHLRKHDIIFIRTDMDRFWETERWGEQPYLNPDALDWLITTYAPKVIGTDASGFEVPGTDYQPNHLNMFKHGIGMVESATNLAALGKERGEIFILPLPIEGIDACPVRIIAFRKEGKAKR